MSFEDYVSENDFVVNKRGELSVKAILLFGKNPQKFFGRARIRFIRFEGKEELTGVHMNVIKDEEFNGRLLDQLNDAIAFVRTQIKEITFLGKDGKFVTIPEYPEFCWKELIVNAVTHRDYSINGTDIQIKMFDDRLTVESPGIFAGNVTEKNIKNTHFSRNKAIAAYMKEYKFVKEFGEGVKRIYKEMSDAKLADPIFKKQDFMTIATIKNQPLDSNDYYAEPQNELQNEPQTEPQNEPQHEPQKFLVNEDEEKIISIIKNNPIVTKKELANKIGKSLSTIKRILSSSKRIKYVGTSKNGHWEID